MARGNPAALVLDTETGAMNARTGSLVGSDTTGPLDDRGFLCAYGPPWRLVLVGAVHIAQALAPMAAAAGYAVTVVDPRAAFASATRFPGFRLICDWPDEALPTLRADATKLRQVLINLMSNAVKFTEPGGAVTVSAAIADDGGMQIAIRDTGIGMTPAETEIALQPFGQVDNSLARAHEGTGLGLPLALRLVELHGGQLQIESVKGTGTTVTVWLPPERVG